MTTIWRATSKSIRMATSTTTEAGANGRFRPFRSGRPFSFLALLAPSACASAISPVTLQTELAAQPSATAVLQHHCDRITGGDMPIRAWTQSTSDAPTPPDIRASLHLQDETAISLRHVSLRCGVTILSDAWNWYVPSRLTPAMNAALDSTRTPFGKAVASLHFHRQTVSSETTGLPPGIILRNRAVLLRSIDGEPIALVEENYLRAALR
ncbi:hypothetical protein JZX93_02605 [Acidomonas methanolica]|nr:hypothetical protein [Acidomonas methanolica]